MPSSAIYRATGIPGLDAVLAGGLETGALGLIIGAPGAGKTVLASQILFHAARQGLQTLVLTSYSEGVEQYINHMRSFDFFDDSLIGTRVQVFALPSLLTDETASPTMTISRTIRDADARLVLLDGFQGVGAMLPDQFSLRKVLSGLAAQMPYLNATLLMTVAGTGRDDRMHAELTVADMALGLQYTLDRRRHLRQLEVIKQRGHAPLPGLHTYTIHTAGIRVIPRIEVYPERPAPTMRDEQASFGLPELDRLLSGGVLAGTTTMIAGAPSTGKTLMSLHWALSGAGPEASTVFLTFGERLPQLEYKARAFGLDIAPALASGALHVIHVSPAELDPDVVADTLLTALERPHVKRVVIDDITILIDVLGNRVRDYVSALTEILYSRQVTGLLLYEVPAFEGWRVKVTETALAGLCDNLIVIQQYEIGGKLRRLLAVLRMRFNAYDQSLREVIIDPAGIRVLPPAETGAGVLAAGASLTGGVAPAPPEGQPDPGTA